MSTRLKKARKEREQERVEQKGEIEQIEEKISQLPTGEARKLYRMAIIMLKDLSSKSGSERDSLRTKVDAVLQNARDAESGVLSSKKEQEKQKRVRELQSRADQIRLDARGDASKLKKADQLEQLAQRIEGSPSDRIALLKKKHSPFTEFMIPTVANAVAKMKLSPLTDASMLEETIMSIEKLLEKTGDLKDIKKSFEQIQQRRALIEEKTKKDKEQARVQYLKSKSTIESAMQDQLEQELGAISDLAGADRVEDEEESEEEMPELGEEPEEAVARLKEVKDREEFATERKYQDRLQEIEEVKRLSLEDVQKDFVRLLDRTKKVFPDVLINSPELVENVQLLDSQILQFPKKTASIAPSPLTREFIASLTTNAIDREIEQLTLVAPKKQKIPDDYIQQQIKKLASRKQSQRELREEERLEREDVEARERPERGDALEDDGGDEEVGGYEEPEEEDEPAEEPEPADSEDEEEPEDDIEMDVKTVQRSETAPLTMEEKLLQGIPGIKSMSDKLFKQIQQEIVTLAGETDIIYNTYQQLENEVVKPFLDLVWPAIGGSRDDFLVALLQVCHRRPIDLGKSWLSAFDLTDEQRFLVKEKEFDLAFAARLKADLESEPPIDIVGFDTFTEVTDRVDAGDQQQWIQANYLKYKDYIPRIIAKLSLVKSITGADSLFATPEQRLLISEYRRRESTDLSKEPFVSLTKMFAGLPIGEQIKAGIPVLPRLSQDLFQKKKQLVERLARLQLSEVEERVDYPVRVAFEQLAPFVPALLINVFVKSSKRISDTRQTFLKKYLLSRFTVEQYIYVKQFMNHPETRPTFDLLLSSMRSALLWARAVLSKKITLDELETRLANKDLLEIAIQLIDAERLPEVSRLFTRRQPIAELEKQFREIAPADKGFVRCENAFLRDCRYAFRSKYALDLPVHGSVDDLKKVEQALDAMLVMQDTGYYRRINLTEGRVSLEKDRESLEDANLEYEKDLLAAVIVNVACVLVEKKVNQVIEIMLRHLDSSMIMATLGYDPMPTGRDLKKPASEKEIVDALLAIDKALSEMFKNRNRDFGEVDSFYAKKLRHVVKLSQLIGRPIQLPDTLNEVLAEEVQPTLSHRQKMLRKYVSVLRKDRREVEIPVFENRFEYTDNEVQSMIDYYNNKVSLEDILRDAGPEGRLLKSVFESYYDLFFRKVVYMIQRDLAAEKAPEFEYYSTAYKKLIAGIPAKFSSSLPDKAKPFFPKIDEVLERLRGYYEHPRHKGQFVKGKYLTQSDSVYRPESRVMVRFHPEMMRLMPRIVLLNRGLPLEYVRGPVPKKIGAPVEMLEMSKWKDTSSVPDWVYPSVLFFQEMINADLRVETDDFTEEEVLIMNGKVYSLGLIDRDGKVKEAILSDYQKLVRLVNLRLTIDILHNELVIKPSKADPQMVFEIHSDAIFYPGYTRDLPEDRVIVQNATTSFDRKIKDLTDLKERQKEKFARQSELDQLLLKKTLTSDGWMRPTIALIREMHRVGKLSNGDIRVNGVDYKCALINKNEATLVAADRVLDMIKEHYGTDQQFIQRGLSAFIPVLESEIEEEKEYSGAKKGECDVCKKVMKGKPWFQTVSFADGDYRVVSVCSEECSEAYRPTK